jgi:hypothetical protein
VTGTELRELRLRMGFSQTEMAEGMDLSLRQYQDIEAVEGLIKRRHEMLAERWALMNAAKGEPSFLTSNLRGEVTALLGFVANLPNPIELK